MRSALIVLLLAVLPSCSKMGGSGSNAPQITFISLSPNEITNGDPESVIVIGFEFSDKDGDIGSTGAIGEPANIFIKQTHDTSQGANAQLPVISPDFQDPDKAIKGTAIDKNPGAFFTLDSLHMQTGDTFHFEIYIKDKAGHESNQIITPDVYIKP